MFASIVTITIQIDTHDFGHTNFENDQNRVHIISDRNAPKSEDIANQIVCDSLVSLINWQNCSSKSFGKKIENFNFRISEW